MGEHGGAVEQVVGVGELVREQFAQKRAEPAPEPEPLKGAWDLAVERGPEPPEPEPVKGAWDLDLF